MKYVIIAVIAALCIAFGYMLRMADEAHRKSFSHAVTDMQSTNVFVRHWLHLNLPQNGTTNTQLIALGLRDDGMVVWSK